MDVVLLHNRGAGNENHSPAELMKLLRRHGFRARYADVRRGLEDQGLFNRGEFVVAAGGDGTVRKVLLRAAETGRVAAILPLGTANNIATSLGISARTPDEVVSRWKTAQRRALDLGVATGPWGRMRFIEGVGLGLISRVMKRLTDYDECSSHEFANANDKLNRDRAVLGVLTHEVAPVHATVERDGRRTTGEFLLLEFLNIRRTGPGIELAPDARPDDQRLNLFIATATQRDSLARKFAEHFGGKGRAVRARTPRLRQASITASACDIRIDDKIVLTAEQIGRRRGRRVQLTVRIEPAAVNVLAG